jgi:hypothetical protein
MLARMRSNKNSYSLPVGLQDGTASLEDSCLQNQTYNVAVEILGMSTQKSAHKCLEKLYS